MTLHLALKCLDSNLHTEMSHKQSMVIVFVLKLAKIKLLFPFVSLNRIFEGPPPRGGGLPVYRSWLYLLLSQMNAHFELVVTSHLT